LQVRKDEIREKILDAAKQRFAGQRYIDTTIADISAESAVSVGNIYRYFRNKQELFAAAVTPELAVALEKLLLQSLRVESGTGPSVHLQRSAAVTRSTVGRDINECTAEEALCSFLCRNWRESIILLERDEGTPYEGLRRRIVGQLGREHLERKQSGARTGQSIAPVLYDNLIAGLVSILRSSHDSPDTMVALFKLIHFYRNGLRTV
jgi:AcrR family transcriptional regulator